MIGSQTTGMIVMDPSDVFSLIFWSQSARNWESGRTSRSMP